MVCVDTPESRTQVYISMVGVLEVHDNVTFEANTAGYGGGEASLPFESGSHLPVVVFCDRVCTGRLVSLRQLTKRR